MQRVGIDAAGEDLAARRNHGVVGPGQAGDAVQEDDDVLAVLHEPFGLLDDHLGHLHVTCRRFVEGGADHFADHRPLHVGDLFRTLVDEQHDEHGIRVVVGDGLGDVLQHHGLAGARRRHHQPALPHADGRQQIDETRRVFIRLVLERNALFGIERGQVVEENLVPDVVRVAVVDGLDLQERKIPLTILRRPDLAGNDVAGAQAETPDLARRYINVIRAGQVVVVRRPQKAEPVGQGFQDTLSVNIPILLGLRLQDSEYEILPPHVRGALDAETLADIGQLVDLLGLERAQVQAVLLHRVLLHGVLLHRVLVHGLRCRGRRAAPTMI